MAHALDVANVFREDAVRPSLDRASGLGQRAASRRRVLSGSRRAGRVTHVTDRSDCHRAVATELASGRRHVGRSHRRPFSTRSPSTTAEVRAFLRVDPPAALARAEEIDRRRAAGQAAGPAGRLPVAVKDLLCTEGEPTTCASRMLENFRPPYDATVVARLQGGRRRAHRQDQHGRVRHGRLDRELGLPDRPAIPGTSTRIPGGSSGGSAAARGRAAWPRWRSAPTPAARSASRPACAASPA